MQDSVPNVMHHILGHFGQCLWLFVVDFLVGTKMYLVGAYLQLKLGF